MLQIIVDWFVYYVLNLSQGSNLGGSINYFIYDSIKIILLLFLMIFAIGFLRTYISSDKIKRWLKHGKIIISTFFASLFGAITPFCSCSSIPIFISFIKAGVPLGVGFSFLVTSPLVNEYLIILMFGFFGWKITAAYVITGMLIGIATGIVLNKMNLEKYLVKDIAGQDIKFKQQKYTSLKSRLDFGLNESISITKKLWIWILLGVAIGALIHNFVPEELIHSIISKTGIFTVPLAVFIGIPLYGSCAAILPIAVVLFQKGIPLGTALAFMMAVAALSLPEAIILRRVMKLKLILIFFSVVAVGLLIIGYLFNFLQGWLV